MLIILFDRVKSTLHAFQKIRAESGVLGLWKGWLPNVQRAAIVNLGGILKSTSLEYAKMLELAM